MKAETALNLGETFSVVAIVVSLVERSKILPLDFSAATVIIFVIFATLFYIAAYFSKGGFWRSKDLPKEHPFVVLARYKEKYWILQDVINNKVYPIKYDKLMFKVNDVIYWNKSDKMWQKILLSAGKMNKEIEQSVKKIKKEQ